METRSKKLLSCKNKIITMFIVISTILMAFTVSAFADDPLTAAHLAGGSGPMTKMFNFFLAIAIPLGVLGLAMSGFSFFTGDEKKHSVAKKRMTYIGLALMVLMLIPTIFKFSSKSSTSQWNPTGGNSAIVQSATESFDITQGPTESEGEGADGEDGEDGEEDDDTP